MGFPADVRGLYAAPVCSVGVSARGTTPRQLVAAYVNYSKILFIANKPPEGEEKTEVAVFLTNNDPTGYDDNNPDEYPTGNNPSVTIDHVLEAPKDCRR